MCNRCEEMMTMIDERVLVSLAIIEAAQNSFMEAYRLCKPESSLDEIEKAWQKSNTCRVLLNLMSNEDQPKENLH
ncbi:hypothetical protein DM141_20340 [Shigella sonnei]|nr:hypothetical protein [Shigella sonnei]